MMQAATSGEYIGESNAIGWWEVGWMTKKVQGHPRVTPGPRVSATICDRPLSQSWPGGQESRPAVILLLNLPTIAPFDAPNDIIIVCAHVY